MITYDMCLAAARNNCYVLGSIPLDFRSIGLCIEVVKHNRDAIRFAPEGLKDRIISAVGEVK